jgi:hypothetical protein
MVVAYRLNIFTEFLLVLFFGTAAKAVKELLA